MTNHAGTHDELLTPTDLAELLGVEVTTLVDWRYRRHGPPWIKLGHRTVRYSRNAVERWLASRQEVPR